MIYDSDTQQQAASPLVPIMCSPRKGVQDSVADIGGGAVPDLGYSQTVHNLPHVGQEVVPPLPINKIHSVPFNPPVRHHSFMYGSFGQGFSMPSTPLVSPQSPLPPVNTPNGFMQYGAGPTTENGGAPQQLFYAHGMQPYYMPLFPPPQPMPYSPTHFYHHPTYLQGGGGGSNYNSLAWQSSQLGYKMMMSKSKWEIHKRRNQQQQCMAEKISRTVYITDLDCSLTEENLAKFFDKCGEIVDVRVCGDPNCPQKFAFIEFTESYAAMKALQWSGQTLGKYVLKVLPSKTAIIPVNKDYMPKTSRDMERCSRTIYVTNINKCIGKDELRDFFETLCGEITVLRLLGDKEHPTRIAFVEFKTKECAAMALNISGYTISGIALRVAPSKTPVRVNESAHLRSPTASIGSDCGFNEAKNSQLSPTSPDFQPNTPPLLSHQQPPPPSSSTHYQTPPHPALVATADAPHSYVVNQGKEIVEEASSDTPTQESSTQN